MKARKNSGFTLIELMVVIVVIGVLAGIALPAFSRYITKSKRPEARVMLRQIADAQEVYFINYRQYSGTFDALDFHLAEGTRLSSTEIRGPRYTYELSQPDGDNTWYCTASGNLDGDPWIDVVAAGRLIPRSP